MKPKTGKTFKKDKSELWDDELSSQNTKRKNAFESKRRFKQKLRRVIDDGDYDELEEHYQ
jgi:hypothetical protein